MRTDTLQELNAVEPYDPAYLTNEPYQIPDISRYEKKFLRKVSILENKLRKERVRCEWDAQQECFRVHRTAESGYPIYRYVRVNMEENDYSFNDLPSFLWPE